MNEEVIGTRQRILHTLLPLVIYLAIKIPFLIYKDWIVDNVLVFLPSPFNEIIYWGFFAFWTVIVFWIVVGEGLFEIFAILRMPRDLVKLKTQRLILTKSVKITDEETQTHVKEKMDSIWLGKKDIDTDEIWDDEEWFGLAEIELQNIKRMAFYSSVRNVARKLETNRPIRGWLIVETTDGDIFMQPKIGDLRRIEGLGL